MKKLLLSLLACWLSWQVVPSVRAQQPGGLDPAFAPATIDLSVYQALPRPGGRALVAGRFSTLNGAAVGPVVQVKADGTLDPDFANSNRSYLPTGDTQVNSIVVATDAFDRTYVALSSTPSFSATLVRLFANGTLDPSFHATIDGAPNALAVQPDGKLVIAGSFSTLNGVTVQGNIARLKEDGSTDTSFDVSPRPGVASFAYTFIYNLVIQPDGKLIIGGGTFPNFDGALTRLNPDGSRDTTFALSSAPGLTFQDLVLLPGGDLIAAYNTSTYNGQPYAYAARFKTHSTDGTDGKIDPAFQVGNALPSFPRKTVVQADGKLVCSVGASVVRLNADGTPDLTFTFGAPSNSTFATVYAQTGDGNLLVAGSLLIGNQFHEGVARLFGSVPGGAATVSVVVPGTANPWLARDGSTDSADTVPAQAPLRVVDLALNAGATLSFTADGGVDNGGSVPTGTPDGDSVFTHDAENGVSGITAPLNSLVGVFIDDTAAGGVSAAPDPLDFSTDASRDYTTLSPALGQLFFIGDGKTSAGAAQQVTVPAGATHLVLGSVDGLGWYNNTGAFAVTIAPGGSGGNNGGSLTVPGSADLWLAGQEDGIFASQGADRAPVQSAVLVPNLTLDPNRGLFITAQGQVTTITNGTTLHPPDGDGFVVHPSEDGVAGTTAPLGALVGVFVGDDAPTSANQPSERDFSFVGIGNSSYSPRLQQAFFIGDGKGAGNLPQTFYPPRGATRLFLGVMDSSVSNDNGGGFTVGVTASTLDPTDLRVGQHVASSSTPGGNGSFALLGDQLTYTFSVRNVGQATFTNAVLHDVLPSYIDLARTVISDGGSAGGGIVTWNLGTLAPGAALTRTLQVTLAQTAPLGTHLVNKGYYASADGLPDVDGLDFPDTLIEAAVSVKISNNAATAKPGGVVRFIYDLLNTTPTPFKKLTLTVPILNGLIFGDAYFVDSNGTRLDAQAVARLKGTAGYDPSSNSAVFTLNALKSSDVYLALELQVPYDFNPKGTVGLPGAQIVVNKYTDGQPITFALADSSSPLSGLPGDKPPALVFGKSVVTGDLATVLLAVNPNAATQLTATALKPYLDLNPNQKAVGQLGNFASLALLTPDQITQVLNPFVGSDADADTNAAVSTVPIPGGKAPNPFVTFALAFSNTGSGKATSVTLSDSAPRGLEIDRDSFFVNGVATPASAIQFNGDGSFALTVKNLKPGKGGLVFYRARVLAPSANGVELGGYIEPTSAQLTIANLTSEVIAPAPDKLLLTGPAHASVSSAQTGDTVTGGLVTYTILYKNDGGQAIKDFRVVSPVPPGGSLQLAQFLDLGQQHREPNGAKGEFLADPGFGATSGLVVFHLGKVKPRGSGLVQVVYQLTAAVNDQPTGALVHQPYVTATGGLPATNALSPDAPLHRQLRRIVTRDGDDASVGSAGAPNTTRPSDSTKGPHLGMTVACAQTVNAGDTFGYTVTAISLGATGIPVPFLFTGFDPAVVFCVPVPAGTEYAGITAGNPVAAPVTAEVQTGTGGQAYVVGTLPALFNAGSSYVTVSFRATGTSRSLIRSPDILLVDLLSGASLHSGPIVTTVTSPEDFFSLQRLVALNTLNAVSTTTFTGPGFQQRVDQINSKSRFTAVINADYLSLENGVVIIPTVGGNIVAQGGGNLVNTNGSNIVAQGGGNIVAQGGGNIVAQGGGNLITIKNIVNGQGQLISQDGNNVANIFAGIVAQGGGNIVAQGGGNIVAQGGGNLQSVGVGVISRDGAGFAASADKALAISQANLGQLTSLNGQVFRSETGNATFAGSGFAAAAAGGAIKVGGLVQGTNDNLSLNHITSQANVVRGGNGIVAQGGGN